MGSTHIINWAKKDVANAGGGRKRGGDNYAHLLS